ncbi:TPA: cation diffusion facilitator family transporter, partial [Klebsiella pneumoniae]
MAFILLSINSVCQFILPAHKGREIMTQHNFENDNKYHERSVQARKSTLVSVV